MSRTVVAPGYMPGPISASIDAAAAAHHSIDSFSSLHRLQQQPSPAMGGGGNNRRSSPRQDRGAVVGPNRVAPGAPAVVAVNRGRSGSVDRSAPYLWASPEYTYNHNGNPNSGSNAANDVVVNMSLSQDARAAAAGYAKMTASAGTGAPRPPAGPSSAANRNSISGTSAVGSNSHVPPSGQPVSRLSPQTSPHASGRYTSINTNTSSTAERPQSANITVLGVSADAAAWHNGNGTDAGAGADTRLLPQQQRQPSSTTNGHYNTGSTPLRPSCAAAGDSFDPNSGGSAVRRSSTASTPKTLNRSVAAATGTIINSNNSSGNANSSRTGRATRETMAPLLTGGAEPQAPISSRRTSRGADTLPTAPVALRVPPQSGYTPRGLSPAPQPTPPPPQQQQQQRAANMLVPTANSAASRRLPMTGPDAKSMAAATNNSGIPVLPYAQPLMHFLSQHSNDNSNATGEPPGTLVVSTTTLSKATRRVRYVGGNAPYDPVAADIAEEEEERRLGIDGGLTAAEQAALMNPAAYMRHVEGVVNAHPSLLLRGIPKTAPALMDSGTRNGKDPATDGNALAPTYLLNDGRRWVRVTNRPAATSTRDPAGARSATAATASIPPAPPSGRATARRDSRAYEPFAALQTGGISSTNGRTKHLVQRHTQQRVVGADLLRRVAPQYLPPRAVSAERARGGNASSRKPTTDSTPAAGAMSNASGELADRVYRAAITQPTPMPPPFTALLSAAAAAAPVAFAPPTVSTTATTAPERRLQANGGTPRRPYPTSAEPTPLHIRRAEAENRAAEQHQRQPHKPEYPPQQQRQGLHRPSPPAAVRASSQPEISAAGGYTPNPLYDTARYGQVLEPYADSNQTTPLGSSTQQQAQQTYTQGPYSRYNDARYVPPPPRPAVVAVGAGQHPAIAPASAPVQAPSSPSASAASTLSTTASSSRLGHRPNQRQHQHQQPHAEHMAPITSRTAARPQPYTSEYAGDGSVSASSATTSASSVNRRAPLPPQAPPLAQAPPPHQPQRQVDEPSPDAPSHAHGNGGSRDGENALASNSTSALMPTTATPSSRAGADTAGAAGGGPSRPRFHAQRIPHAAPETVAASPPASDAVYRPLFGQHGDGSAVGSAGGVHEGAPQPPQEQLQDQLAAWIRASAGEGGGDGEDSDEEIYEGEEDQPQQEQQLAATLRSSRPGVIGGVAPPPPPPPPPPQPQQQPQQQRAGFSASATGADVPYSSAKAHHPISPPQPTSVYHLIGNGTVDAVMSSQDTNTQPVAVSERSDGDEDNYTDMGDYEDPVKIRPTQLVIDGEVYELNNAEDGDGNGNPNGDTGNSEDDDEVANYRVSTGYEDEVHPRVDESGRPLFSNDNVGYYYGRGEGNEVASGPQVAEDPVNAEEEDGMVLNSCSNENNNSRNTNTENWRELGEEGEALVDPAGNYPASGNGGVDGNSAVTAEVPVPMVAYDEDTSVDATLWAASQERERLLQRQSGPVGGTARSSGRYPEEDGVSAQIVDEGEELYQAEDSSTQTSSLQEL